MIGIERIAMPRNQWGWPHDIHPSGNVSGSPAKRAHGVLKDTVAAYPRMTIVTRHAGEARVDSCGFSYKHMKIRYLSFVITASSIRTAHPPVPTGIGSKIEGPYPQLFIIKALDLTCRPLAS
jgi:hypothetical protein